MTSEDADTFIRIINALVDNKIQDAKPVSPDDSGSYVGLQTISIEEELRGFLVSQIH